MGFTFLKNKINNKEYNLFGLFEGLMPSNVLGIQGDKLVLLVTEDDISRWKSVVQNKEELDSILSKSPNVIAEMFNEREVRSLLLYVTLN